MFLVLKELQYTWGDENIYIQVTFQSVMMCANFCYGRVLEDPKQHF